MVHHKGTFEPNVTISAHRFVHVDVSFVDEHFLEISRGSPDISEVNTHDSIMPAELADCFYDVNPHFRNTTLTRQHSVGVAWIYREYLSVILERGNDPGIPCKRFRDRGDHRGAVPSARPRFPRRVRCAQEDTSGSAAFPPR